MALYQSEPKGIYIGNNGTPRLPSAYQEVEYLQSANLFRSSAAPYIDTGYICSNNTKVEWKMGGWTQIGSTQMFGARNNWSSTGRGYAIVSDAYQFNGNAGVNHGMNDGNIHTGSFGQDGLYVDGDLKTQIPTATFTCSRNLYLFALNGDSYENAYMKYYYFKMYESGTLVRYFIPCYRVSDNKPGMYDLVNDVFYFNANTSYDSQYPFTVGSDYTPVDREIKHVYKGSIQVWPTYRWQPGANTIAYFPFEEDALDYSGNNHTLTNNGAQATTGRNFTSASQVNGTFYDATFANFWVKANQQAGGTYNLAVGAIDTISNQYNLYSYWTANNNTILATIDSSWNAATTPGPNDTSIWHNICFGHDGTNYIYGIDGVYGVLYNGLSPFYQQYPTIWVAHVDTNITNADIDIAYMIFEDRCWTAQEIADYYNGTKSKFGIS